MSEGQGPDGRELLRREANARQRGSGIETAGLEGQWWLDQLWSRQGGEQTMPAALLRSLGACLAITIDTAGTATDTGAAPGDGPGAQPRLLLRNSVQLGPLELRFTGPGWLQGRRPLLRFHFRSLELVWGDRQLWHTDLPEPTAQAMPFFALIACERDADQRWLAARGRGGGLALWRLRAPALHD
jgi:hypothetical protein